MQLMSKLLLNVVSIDSIPAAKVPVGKQSYDKTTLDSLRRQHRGSYLVKRGGEDGNSILSVPLRPGLKPNVAEIEQQLLSEAPWLMAPLALEALLGFFVNLKRPVLRSRPLRVLSQRPSNIFPSGHGLPDWLQRRIVLNFDTRIVRRSDRTSSVVLACGVRTRNVIDASCAEMSQAGVPLVGRYVATRRAADDPRIQSSLRLAGRVTGFRGSVLQLDDHGDGPPTLESSEAFLEPRRENMAWCVRHFLGTDAEKILEMADNEAAKHLGGPERLAHPQNLRLSARAAH
jgi:hypothetical protein